MKEKLLLFIFSLLAAALLTDENVVINNCPSGYIATASDGKSVQMTSYIDNMQFSILHLDGNAYVLLPQKKSYTELTEQLLTVKKVRSAEPLRWFFCRAV